MKVTTMARRSGCRSDLALTGKNEEHCLKGIFCFVAIEQDASANAKDELAGSSNRFAEGVFLAPIDKLADQFRVGRLRNE